MSKSIFNMVTTEWDSLHNEIQAVLDKDKEYQANLANFNDIVGTLSADKKAIMQIEDIVVGMECSIKEVCYGKGFADAVRLMSACYLKGGSDNE